MVEIYNNSSDKFSTVKFSPENKNKAFRILRCCTGAEG